MSLLVDEYERLLVRIFLGLCLLVMASLLVMCNAWRTAGGSMETVLERQGQHNALSGKGFRPAANVVDDLAKPQVIEHLTERPWSIIR
jgi:hypothetical protein